MLYSEVYGAQFNPSSEGLKTNGTMWHQHTMKLGRDDYDNSEQAILNCLEKIFAIKDLSRVKQLECWYDEMVGMGDPGPNWFDGTHLFGVFFTRDNKGRPVLTHFFVRKLVDFTGPLDTWKDDLVFPYATEIFSVCAVFPEGYEQPLPAVWDCRNHGVMKYSWERMKEKGVDPELIIQKMRSPQYYLETPPFRKVSGVREEAPTET